ncbi:hypothetical protein [Paenibacillus polymyxa]|uniref:hypothetical protein n=1 Tax=Paenibacillus polymyxa TaxID=1406 RepID=UPI00129BA76E|nr:hypothetical protein [Paenibacillus polymyxa]KAE8560214.1 hypothetical protein BJH92_10050 [Paenibacillus polymyxa]MCJ1221253.1 hypothetical protein [Paenibacillus polymyxa]
MDKKRYLARHWKYWFRPQHTLETLSRKSKKAICKYLDETAKEYEQDESFRLSGLPDCEYCDGSRYVPFDIGSYECGECEGTGKTGWVYQDGKRVPGKQVNHG